MVPELGEAMRNGGVSKTDARGLMPLDEARAIVAAATEFRPGAGRMIDGRHVHEGDRLWAALLSLEDAPEFVREASRLRWLSHPRGKDNVDPVLRYGVGIEPWLRSFVRGPVLVDVPWCVVPCFRLLGGPDVFDLLWSVRTVVDELPPDGVVVPARAPEQADMRANAMMIHWIWHEPAERFPLLARRVATGDGRAALMLRSLAQTAPSAIHEWVRAALGDAEADAVFTAAGAPKAVDEHVILASLDAGASQPGAWPVFEAQDPAEAYVAMRLLAVRARVGDAWGVVFERAEGACEDDARVRPFIQGSGGSGWVPEGCRPLGVFEDEDDRGSVQSPYDLEGVTVVGPRGPVVLSGADLPGLLPDRMTARGIRDPRYTLLVRAYLARFPDAFWSAPHDAVSVLGLGDDLEIIVCSTAWEHPVSGRPSDSRTIRSLAAALAGRDGSRFDPGTPNVDWRLHARHPVERERA